MKIFLDDQRTPHMRNGYNIVRNYKDCIILLSACNGTLGFVSLDYDLRDDYCGLDALIFMYENKIKPQHINVHSGHEQGAAEMLAYAREHFPGVYVTCNQLSAEDVDD